MWMSVLGKTIKAGETGIRGVEKGHPCERRTVTAGQSNSGPGKVWVGKENPTQPRDRRARNEDW